MLKATWKHPKMTQDNLGNLSWSTLLQVTSKNLLVLRELANKFHKRLAVILSEVVGNEGLEEEWQEWM